MNEFYYQRNIKNFVEVIVDNNGILWLNKKNIEEGLSHSNLPVITKKYHSDYKKYRYQLVDKWNKQPSRIFLHKDFALKVIMDCGTVESLRLKENLGLIYLI